MPYLLYLNFKMTSLKLFKKRPKSACNGKVLDMLKINTGKHELVVSAGAYKDGDWQEIRCT